ncbi:MAG: winged helix DNA-binding protein [Eubacteriales bacterium]|nr:winged helix DNA-binding protein [Eubacteriales bacterium]
MKNNVEALINGQMLRKLFDKKFQSVREEYQLRQIELDILYLIARYDAQKTEKDLVKMCGASKAHVSKSVENLRQKGFVAVEGGKKDRRCVYLHVTEEGQRAADRIRELREEVTSLVCRGITEEEKAVLLRVVLKVKENIQNSLESES